LVTLPTPLTLPLCVKVVPEATSIAAGALKDQRPRRRERRRGRQHAPAERDAGIGDG
jgi:hypothetical protein